MSLTGKKIVIIGGTSGIGRATAKAAAAAGAHVVIGARSEERLEEAQQDLVGHVDYCKMDVRDLRGMDYCIEQIGPFDHLVFTAAEAYARPFLETPLDEARKAFDTKFWGPYAAAQYAAPALLEGGSITFFSGTAAHKPVSGLSILAAADGAVEALVRSLAVELSPIRVNAVCPGLVDTHGLEDERREELAAGLPAGRVGEAEDVAHAVLFLVQNPYVTGAVLRIDGGGTLI